MIKKFLKLKKLGVFKDFEWDKHVVDSQGQAMCLQDVNIFFGRNYSGKTTLSRIFRAFEVGAGLEKYDGGTFKLQVDEKGTVDENTLGNLSYPVRVFNEDFVRENLFLSMPQNKE